MSRRGEEGPLGDVLGLLIVESLPPKCMVVVGCWVIDVRGLVV